MDNNVQDIILYFSQEVKQILGNKLDKVILYGSYARGDYNEHSDIDIMILTTLTDQEIEKVETEIFDLAFNFQMDYGIDISVVIKNKQQFNYWLGALPFYNNVQKDGIVYAGEPAEVLEVIKVKPLDDMIMLITFSNGETKLFDATVLTGSVYEPLKDDKIFKNPVIEYGIVTWDEGNIDCSPEYMYKNSYEYPEASSF